MSVFANLERMGAGTGAILFRTLGWLCVGLGVIGIFVPLIPSTSFFVLAALCFARSSPRLKAAILAHPQIGPPVQAFLAHRIIPRGAKIAAAMMMALSFFILTLSQPPVWVLALAGAAMAGALAYMLPKPSRAPQPALAS